MCCIALSFAVPAPRDIKNDQQQLENIEDLKDGEEEKDLKGAESAYHGWYGGYPYYPYRFVTCYNIFGVAHKWRPTVKGEGTKKIYIFVDLVYEMQGRNHKFINLKDDIYAWPLNEFLNFSINP